MIKKMVKKKIVSALQELIADGIEIAEKYDLNASLKLDPIKGEYLVVFKPRRKEDENV